MAQVSVKSVYRPVASWGHIYLRHCVDDLHEECHRGRDEEGSSSPWVVGAGEGGGSVDIQISLNLRRLEISSIRCWP